MLLESTSQPAHTFFLCLSFPDQNSYVAHRPVGAGRRGAIKRTIKSSEGRLPKNGDECQVHRVNRFLLPSGWWVAVPCAWKGLNEHTRVARLRSFDQNFQIAQDFDMDMWPSNTGALETVAWHNAEGVQEWIGHDHRSVGYSFFLFVEPHCPVMQLVSWSRKTLSRTPDYQCVFVCNAVL